jgi:hypothetical protein
MISPEERERQGLEVTAACLEAAGELNDLTALQVARHDLRCERLARAHARAAGLATVQPGGILRRAGLEGYTRAGGGPGWVRVRVLL